MRSFFRLGRNTLSVRSNEPVGDHAHRALRRIFDPVLACLQSNLDRPVRSGEGAFSRVVLELRVDPTPREPRGFRLFQTRVARVHQYGTAREICHLGDSHILILERLFHWRRKRPVQRLIRISSPTPELLFESAWFAILSTWGEELDLMGFHRIHALGLSVGGRGVALIGESGVGKSTFGYRVLERTNLGIFGDEIPLVGRDGKIHAFPLPIACPPAAGDNSDGIVSQGVLFQKNLFQDKVMFPIPRARCAQASRLETLIWMRRSKRTSLVRVPRWRVAAPLFRHLVVGVGVPQMAEFLLRPSLLLNLVVVAFSRLSAAMRILLRAECWVLNVSPEIEVGWDLLKREFLLNDPRITLEPRLFPKVPSRLPPEVPKT